MRPRGGAILLMIVTALTAAVPVFAAESQGNLPVRRETVVDLAYVLGEMHALQRLCAGPDDDSWRAKMTRLMEIEKPDDLYRRRLTTRFNDGYMDGSAGFTACDPESQAAERAMAEKGRALSRRLARTAGF